jgi:hypothetical protein
VTCGREEKCIQGFDVIKWRRIKMGRKYGTYVRIREMHDGFLWEKLKERNSSGGIGTN